MAACTRIAGHRHFRTSLVAAGLGAVAFAAFFDVQFVERFLAADGAVTADTALAIRHLRALTGVSGALLLAAGAFLPRLVRRQRIRRVLEREWCSRVAILLAPVALLAGVAVYKQAFGPAPALYLLLLQEDSVVEWLTALAYVAAAVVSFSIAREMLRREKLVGVTHAALSAFFIFVALEEVSYGQRIFGVATPEPLEEVNVQEETNIHNIEALHEVSFVFGPLLLGLATSLGWAGLRLWSRLTRRAPAVLEQVVPPWFTASYFAPLIPYFAVAQLDEPLGLMIWQDHELFEFIAGMGFVIFTFHVRAHVGETDAGSGSRARRSASS